MLVLPVPGGPCTTTCEAAGPVSQAWSCEICCSLPGQQAAICALLLPAATTAAAIASACPRVGDDHRRRRLLGCVLVSQGESHSSVDDSER